MQEVGTLRYQLLPTFNASTTETESPPMLGRLGIVLGGSLSTESYSKFASHYARLDSLSKDHSLWADEDTFPSRESLAVARFVLQQLEELDLLPSKIVATVDNGVTICFVKGKKYADIEATSTGSLLCVLSDSITRPTVWEFEPYQSEIAQSIVRIREFIEPSASSKNDTGAAESGRLIWPTSSLIQAV